MDTKNQVPIKKLIFVESDTSVLRHCVGNFIAILRAFIRVLQTRQVQEQTNMIILSNHLSSTDWTVIYGYIVPCFELYVSEIQAKWMNCREPERNGK